MRGVGGRRFWVAIASLTVTGAGASACSRIGFEAGATDGDGSGTGGGADTAAVILVQDNADAGIQIDGTTAYPRWDGEAVDYEWVTAVMWQSGMV